MLVSRSLSAVALLCSAHGVRMPTRGSRTDAGSSNADSVGFTDLGAGCCSEFNDKSIRLFSGALDEGGVEACQKKCIDEAAAQQSQCGFAMSGWDGGSSTWCVAMDTRASCSPLNTSPSACGSGGHTGVRSFQNPVIPSLSCGVKGTSGSSAQIVNGEDASECEWSWQVQLSRNGVPFCGGSLIAPRWVLTSKHCADWENFVVIAGDNGVGSSNRQVRQANGVYPDTHSNLMLISLASPMIFNECVGSVCLPTQGNVVAADTACWTTGWGALGRSGGSSPDILQEVSVTTISNCSDCGYEGNAICAQGRTPDGTDACPEGDGGEPLVCEDGDKWTLYGVGRGFSGVWERVDQAMGRHKFIELLVVQGVAPCNCSCWGNCSGWEMQAALQ